MDGGTPFHQLFPRMFDLEMNKEVEIVEKRVILFVFGLFVDLIWVCAESVQSELLRSLLQVVSLSSFLLIGYGI